jgi:hypothetical protein
MMSNKRYRTSYGLFHVCVNNRYVGHIDGREKLAKVILRANFSSWLRYKHFCHMPYTFFGQTWSVHGTVEMYHCIIAEIMTHIYVYIVSCSPSYHCSRAIACYHNSFEHWNLKFMLFFYRFNFVYIVVINYSLAWLSYSRRNYVLSCDNY